MTKLKSNFEKSFGLYLSHMETDKEIRILKRHLKKSGRYSEEFTGDLRYALRYAKEEARCLNIARGFTKGLKYEQIENNPRTEPDFHMVTMTLYDEGTYVNSETVEAWAHAGV